MNSVYKVCLKGRFMMETHVKNAEQSAEWSVGSLSYSSPHSSFRNMRLDHNSVRLIAVFKRTFGLRARHFPRFNGRGRTDVADFLHRICLKARERRFEVEVRGEKKHQSWNHTAAATTTVNVIKRECNVNFSFNNGRRLTLVQRFTVLGLKPVTITGVKTNIAPA